MLSGAARAIGRRIGAAAMTIHRNYLRSVAREQRRVINSTVFNGLRVRDCGATARCNKGYAVEVSAEALQHSRRRTIWLAAVAETISTDDKTPVSDASTSETVDTAAPTQISAWQTACNMRCNARM